MQELHDMMKSTEEMEEISDRLLEKEIYERKVRDYFNQQIHSYLRTKQKSMWELDMKDLSEMTERYNSRQKQVFMEQLMQAMRVNRGKSIKWIKEHNKSILLNQLD